jgi:ATP-dependent protease ClpP protease subunit
VTPAAPVQVVSRRLVVWLYGPIGLAGVDLSRVNAALSDLADGLAVIVRIDSAGGNLDDALRTACLIRESKARSLAIIDRCCFSAATVIAAACDRIHMRASALWLTHRSSNLANGDYSVLQAAAELCLSNDLRLARFIGRRRGIGTSTLLEIADRAEFLSASEAKANLLVDRVIADLPSKSRNQAPLLDHRDSATHWPDISTRSNLPRSSTMFGKIKSKCESEFNNAVAAMATSENLVNRLQDRLASERLTVGSMSSQVDSIKRELHAQLANGDPSAASQSLCEELTDRLYRAESRLSSRREFVNVSCTALIEAKAELHQNERRAAAAQLALAWETMTKLEHELAETIGQKLSALIGATFAWADCKALQEPYWENRPERTSRAVVLKLVDSLQLPESTCPPTSVGAMPVAPIRSSAISDEDRNLIIRNYAGSGADIEAFKRILGNPTTVAPMGRLPVAIDPVEYHLAQIA